MQTLRLVPAQRQTLSPRLIQAIGLVQMSGAELQDFLREAAADNPCLRLSLPRPAGPAPEAALVAETPGLVSHVAAQIALWRLSPAEMRLSEAFLEALEPTGWLGLPLDRIAAAAGCDAGCAERFHARLLGLDPAGIFARDLGECLAQQARERDQHCAVMAEVLAGLDTLAAAGPEAFARARGLPPAEVAACLARIRRMDPKPGLAFDGAPVPQREPDLIAHHRAAGWEVELNRSTLPVLAVAPAGKGPALGAALAEARWIARALDQRGRTLQAIGAEVVRRQSAYLCGEVAYREPLLIGEVAGALGLHPSTVSRAVQGLLISAPRGMQAVRALFAQPADAAGHSSDAARHRLQRLIAAEDARAPLDDAALARGLAAEGIALSRRTVAKYRKTLGIAPATARRRDKAPGVPATKETHHV